MLKMVIIKKTEVLNTMHITNFLKMACKVNNEIYYLTKPSAYSGLASLQPNMAEEAHTIMLTGLIFHS